MTSDIEIARSISLKPITEIAEKLSIPQDALHPYGKHIAKVSQDFLDEKPLNPQSKMILVTAISPTSAGEGKTTTTVGLGDALAALGKKTAIALREPSLGPCFGVKGGAAGGGYAQIVPMESINLHFTGDFHAITSAHNLLSAMLDNQFYWGNPARVDSRRITWRRAMDMNDRSLRQIVSSLGGASNGFPREDGFDITVASEVMAVFCLATSLTDLQERLAQMVVGTRMGSKGREFVTASEIKAPPAMTVLLKDAFQPNLVQSLAGTPAFVHGGPFANIAHGCNSVQATTAALKLADYVVTEAGFGADLGAEKFLNIKCRKTGLRPAAAVVVATVRALKMHGGVAEADLKQENLPALQAGFANLARHVENVRGFGVPVVVGINRFTTDTQAELDWLQQACRDTLDTDAVICTHWADGAKGAQELATKVAALADANDKPTLNFTYRDDQPLLDKMNAIACKIYRADGIEPDAKVKEQATILETAGFGHLPVCMAKTQSSFSANPQLRGAPSGFTIPIRSLRLSAGAGFVVAICGDIMTMPGLPRSPVAERIHLNAQGQIEGLS